MKLIRYASGKTLIRLSYAEWLAIGEKLGIIEAGRIPMVPWKDFRKFLGERGYVFVRQRASHQRWCNKSIPRCISVATHGNEKDIHPKVLKTALEQMGEQMASFRSWWGK